MKEVREVEQKSDNMRNWFNLKSKFDNTESCKQHKKQTVIEKHYQYNSPLNFMSFQHTNRYIALHAVFKLCRKITFHRKGIFTLKPIKY